MGQIRKRNHGIQKICECAPRQWPKCAHPWHFNYKPKGGPAYRFSLDVELGRHIEGKTEAAQAAEDIRTAIRAGTFRRRAEQSPTPPANELDGITLARLIDTYVERSAKPVSANDRGCLTKMAAATVQECRLGEAPIANLTTDTIELFFAQLQQSGLAASTRNKYVQAVKAMFRWATKKGYLARNPVADAESIKREKHAKRNRRLAADILNAEGKIEREGEERRLLAVAGTHLQRLVVAALETGMRRGEL